MLGSDIQYKNVLNNVLGDFSGFDGIDQCRKECDDSNDCRHIFFQAG